MPHLLKILREGVVIMDFEGAAITDHHTLQYSPQAPDLDPVEVQTALQSGGEIPVTLRRNVTESARVLLTAATASLLQAEVRKITDAFLRAERRQKYRTGLRYFVQFQPDGGDQTWRSEILNGRVDVGPEAVDWQWTALKIEVVVTWTRRYYWEGVGVPVPLSNGNGTDITLGLAIYNHNDSDTGHDNFVDIDGTDIEGGLPAPIDLQIKRTDSYSFRADRWFIGSNIYSVPASLGVIIEGETSTGLGSSIASGAASGGNYEQMTWSSTSETIIAIFPLSTGAILNLADGNYFRILMKFFTKPVADLSIRWEIRFQVTPMWTGPFFKLETNRELQDGGVIQLPPTLAGESSVASMDLYLWGLRVANPTTLDLDFIQITPLDGWRELDSKGYGVVTGGVVQDDGLRGKVWSASSPSGAKVPNYIGKGDPIVVWPGQDQRIYILHDGQGGNAEIDRQAEVQIIYRPRVTTI